MSEPRVLFVNHTSTISGAEKVLLDVAAGHPESSAFLFENGPLNEKMAAGGTPVVASRTGGALSALTRSARASTALPLTGKLSVIVAEVIAASRRHDVIYANSQKAFVLGAIAAAVTRKPLIWHLHDIITPEHFGVRQRRLQVGLANRYCYAVICPSQAVADAFVAAGGKARCCVIANGVNVSGDTRSRQDLRRSLGLPMTHMIGVFSRLAPWKGQHVVLRALSRLPNVTCVLAGASLFEEQSYERCLRALVDELDIADRVLFLGQRDDVPKLMQAVDVVVHPSVSPEPFALTLLEAMQLRAPVIATDNGGSRDALDDGNAGTLIPAADTDALASAIRSALQNPAHLSRQIDHAETRAKERYSVARMQAQINNLIGSVAAEARGC